MATKKMSMRTFISLIILLTMTVLAAGQQAPDSLSYRLQEVLDSILQAEGWPGMTLAAELSDGRRISMASGWADREEKIPMAPGSRMFAGSVGKIFVAPLVLQLVVEQHLDHALELADEVVIIARGEVTFRGTPQEARELDGSILLPSGNPAAETADTPGGEP